MPRVPTPAPSRLADLRSAVAALLVAALALVPTMGCDGEVTEEDLDKWSNNDIGLERITEVVVDARQPMATRVRALEVVVEKGFGSRIVGMLDAIQGDQDQVVAGLVPQLLAHLEATDDFQLDAKDALMRMQRYLDDAAFEPIRVAVAQWAFRDVDWEAPKDTVKAAIETRISSGQIRDLKAHGWEGAAILVSHGFTDKMLEILSDAKTAKASDLMLRGIEKLHDSEGVGMHHIAAIAQTATPMAADYLFRLYLDEELDQDFRDTAFNEAINLLDEPAVQKEPQALVTALFKLMEGDVPQDRWIAAIRIVRLTGVAQLDGILSRFADDKIYGKAEEDPTKSLTDFCLDIFDLGHGEAAAGTFMSSLKSPNRVVRAISIACLKMNESFLAKGALQPLAAGAGASAPPVAGAPPSEGAPPPGVSLADFLGVGVTEATLAQNAIDGLTMLESVRAEESSGAMPKPVATNKALIIKFDLKSFGDVFKRSVDREFAAFKKEYDQDPAKFALP